MTDIRTENSMKLNDHQWTWPTASVVHRGEDQSDVAFSEARRQTISQCSPPPLDRVPVSDLFTHFDACIAHRNPMRNSNLFTTQSSLLSVILNCITRTHVKSQGFPTAFQQTDRVLPLVFAVALLSTIARIALQLATAVAATPSVLAVFA